MPTDVLKALGLEELAENGPGGVVDSDVVEVAAGEDGEETAVEERQLTRTGLPLPPAPELPAIIAASRTLQLPPEELIQVGAYDLLAAQLTGGVSAVKRGILQLSPWQTVALRIDLPSFAANTISQIDVGGLWHQLDQRLSEKDAAYLESIQRLNERARAMKELRQQLTSARLKAEEARRVVEEAQARIEQLTPELESAAAELRSADEAVKNAAKELARFNRESAAATVTPLTGTTP